MTHDEALLFLRAEIALLRSVREPMGVKAAHAMAERLEVLSVALGFAELATSDRRGNLASEVNSELRAALSRNASKNSGKTVPAFTKAAQDVGHSLRSLSEAIDVTHSYLSQIANGIKPMTPKMKARIDAELERKRKETLARR